MRLRDERLYYDASELREFEAQVSEQFERDGKWYVRLNRSAFYPTSGGQPHDTGYLNDVPVSDVVVEGVAVYHVTPQPLPLGETVCGRIDWERRFDFMQQHCGQHILSACFEQLLDIDTVSFHLGDEIVTIDLAVGELSWEDVQRAELLANEIIWQDRHVFAQFVSEAELAALPLRHPPKVAHDVRIVTIEGFDHNPCGGTHPSSTGKVGQIKVLRMERMRGNVRLGFVCGRRALREHEHRAAVVRTLSQRLSAGLDDLLAAVDQLQAHSAAQDKELAACKQRLAELTADRLLTEMARLSTGTSVGVFALTEPADMAELRAVAASVVERLAVPGVLVLVGEAGDRVFVQVQSSGAEKLVAANDLLAAILQPVQGKGGGTARAAQGSAPRAAGVTAEMLARLARDWLSARLE